MFDQDELTINRLLAIYNHLDEWREQEMKKASESRKVD